jgi:translation initiation factor IF-3
MWIWWKFPDRSAPVCKLMDYGKFKYEQSKKRHEAKQKQKQVQIKEIKFRPGTDDGDYNVKLRNLIRFLNEGDKAKITLRFRGREMAHQDIGWHCSSVLRPIWLKLRQSSSFPSWKVVKW